MFLKSNYQKSNAITSVKFLVSDLAKETVSQLLKSQSTESRQQLGEVLLDELSDGAGIDIVKLKISQTRQYHKKYQGRVVSKRYGYYRPQSCYIYIQNLTAVRGQVLAAKTFLDTLLHEWLHHYDTKKLQLNSIHTAGFYLRLKSLKERLDVY
ncbi:MAG: hypothetical protein UV78_C0008G0024 [Parcubacteria group bacterium GW2011_GWA2_43_17]|nr:MAG: hypothetical protein UV78_C0008G0024 [Parcubacteria group bacterium GW2011_GWA2_43_17]KKT94130.1 MAG: hypothetical protein UW91_C0005G0023 [Parcubacteria group bacterium GW2011_GWF2_45_11]KKT97035.1 MAG: hypothetical protein UW98_C0026G0012 [Parcubacteria group bacterium GW2011_GWC2_45_15]OGY92452.1 MAG: hypothetical protein A2260_04225 [Candidatus Komeilibacteria bacterium RIFOXYA2_FULL_45_9]OGY94773.1 MAG: hypothetical protein A3J95_01300 [Candidatus Komeilibacteria bacterium RIFOXYC2